MEKLTIEHLAPYLPYQLKFKHPLGQFEMIGLKNEQTGVVFNYKGDTLSTYFYEVQPILRPISDLKNPPNDGSDYYSFITKLNVECALVNDATFDTDLDFYTPENNSDYFSLLEALRVYNWLIKNHFDVFGLIEKGLAIGINTLTTK